MLEAALNFGIVFSFQATRVHGEIVELLSGDKLSGLLHLIRLLAGFLPELVEDVSVSLPVPHFFSPLVQHRTRVRRRPPRKLCLGSVGDFELGRR